MSEFGNYLKGIRGKMTLREAAKRSGLSHSYISSIENDRHPTTGGPVKPSPDTLKQLAKAYNHDYQDLMKAAGYLDEEQEQTEEQKKATRELIEFLNDPNSTIDGMPIPKDLRDTIIAYVDIQTATGKYKKE